jgi:hypothetical protein
MFRAAPGHASSCKQHECIVGHDTLGTVSNLGPLSFNDVATVLVPRHALDDQREIDDSGTLEWI